MEADAEEDLDDSRVDPGVGEGGGQSMVRIGEPRGTYGADRPAGGGLQPVGSLYLRQPGVARVICVIIGR
jgi:hypothetical protein